MSNVTPEQIKAGFAVARQDLEAAKAIINELEQLLPLAEPIVEDIAKGGLAGYAGAAMGVLGHITVFKTQGEAIVATMKTFKA
jgi:N-acetylmuramic acid 6-phosphate (MurNAc-6-P) etherase